MKFLQWISFVLLSIQTIVRTAADDKHNFGSSCNIRDICVRFEPSLESLYRFFLKVRDIKFHRNPSCGSRADTCGRTDGRKDGQRDWQKDVTKLVRVFRDYANAWFSLTLWSTIHFITAVLYNMSHFPGKTNRMICYGTKLRNPNLYKTAVSYISIFIESEHVAPLCASKRGRGCGEMLYCLLPARFLIPEFPLIHWWVFSAGYPLRLIDVRRCGLEGKKQVISRSTNYEYMLFKCLWKNIICIVPDDNRRNTNYNLSYDTRGCVLLNYLCFAGNWNPARTECGFLLIHFLVIWAR